MALEGLESAARTVEALATRMREVVRPAESLAENKANNIIYTVSELLDELALAMKRLKCVAEAVGAEGGKVTAVCTSWRVLESDGDTILVRVKPETVIRVGAGSLFFHRGVVRLSVNGTTVRVCKWGYCKEFDAARRETIIRELPQILYILRHVSNAVRKSAEAALVCAKNTAAACVRI